MTSEQLTILLNLYKNAVKKNVTTADIEDKIKETRFKIDTSFVQDGKEDMNLGEYLNELLELQTSMT